MRVLMFIFILLVVLIFIALVFVWLVLAPEDRKLLVTPQKTVQVNGVERSYRVINSSRDEPKPLVIGLHGYRDRSWWLSAYSGLHNLAAKEDFTLALPDGKRQSWNGVFCCGWSYVNNVEDIAFIRTMIEEIARDTSIDENRIYVVGFSNGGILAQRLLAQEPDLFAAGASVMSGVGDKDNTLDIADAKAPLLLVNGKTDQYVPLEQTRDDVDGFNFLPALETADIWAEQYELEERQKTEKHEYDEYTWATDTEDKLQLRVYEAGHRWPEWRLWDFPNKAPESTRDVWRFLSQHRK